MNNYGLWRGGGRGYPDFRSSTSKQPIFLCVTSLMTYHPVTEGRRDASERVRGQGVQTARDEYIINDLQCFT